MKKKEDGYIADPVFQGVSLEQFIGFASSALMTDREVRTPRELAVKMASRPYEPWWGCACFYALPTPQEEWGWAYETVSGRQLIWLPGGTVFTRGLRESQNFRDWVEEALGNAVKLAEPEWLEDALMLSISVDRPCVPCVDDDESSARDNEGFFTAISRKPFEFYEHIKQQQQEEFSCSCEFIAAQIEQAQASREERMRNAFQALKKAAATN